MISAYIDTLRQNGLDGAVDWNGLAHELKSFQATSPEELEDGLNYMASRYVAALDKLEPPQALRRVPDGEVLPVALPGGFINAFALILAKIGWKK